MNGPSDKTEAGIRFGCGFVFGLMICTASLLFGFATENRSMIAFVVVVAIFCGLLAVRYGNYFWKNLSRWLWWLS